MAEWYKDGREGGERESDSIKPAGGADKGVFLVAILIGTQGCPLTHNTFISPLICSST